MQYRTKFIRATLLGWAALSAAATVFAALGQGPSTSPTNSTIAAVPVVRKLSASSSANSGLYVLHQYVLESGTTVVEYASTGGVVFAINWRGPVLPDLSILLGRYFNAFKSETGLTRAVGKRGSPMSVGNDQLVIKSSGRMRGFSGYAYVPDLIPAGVNINDVLQ
jgi:hypothetical protein